MWYKLLTSCLFKLWPPPSEIRFIIRSLEQRSLDMDTEDSSTGPRELPKAPVTLPEGRHGHGAASGRFGAGQERMDAEEGLPETGGPVSDSPPDAQPGDDDDGFDLMGLLPEMLREVIGRVDNKASKLQGSINLQSAVTSQLCTRVAEHLSSLRDIRRVFYDES